MREKLNKLISIAIENSNLEDKDFSKLNGKVILIDLKNTNTDIYFLVENNCISIIENADVEPNLILEGTPIGFINYTNNFGNEHNIKISGDASLAESFSKLAEKTNIDWESIIAEYINDDVAFYSSKIFEYVKTRRKEVGSSIERNIKEYLKDETDIIPTKEEITNYVSDVDKVRQKLDLLTAKLNKIKSK